MEILQSLAVLGMLLLAFGVMFRVVKLKTVGFYILFLLMAPVLLPIILNSGRDLLGAHLTWQEWGIIILVVLVGLRLLFQSLFGKRSQ